jgi:hypothetical protein
MYVEPDRRDARLREEVERDLAREFPWVPVGQIRVLVECLWAEFENADNRDFVPVLVRKQAREEVRDHFYPAGVEAAPGPSRVRRPTGRR